MAERKHYRTLQPIRSELVHTQESQRIGPVFDSRLQIDFRDNHLLVPTSRWRGRTSFVNRSTVRTIGGGPDPLNLLPLVDLRTLDEGIPPRLTLQDLVQIERTTLNTERKTRTPNSSPRDHRAYDILLSEWASVVAAQAPWKPCSFPSFFSDFSDRDLEDHIKASDFRPTQQLKSSLRAELERVQLEIGKVLAYWKTAINLRNRPLNILVTESHLVHCGLPAYPLAITTEGVLEVLVLFPSREDLVHDQIVGNPSRGFRSRASLISRTEGQKSAEYARELVRYLTSIARAGLSSSPSATSARLLVIREEDFASWQTADLCAEFTLSASKAQDVSGHDSPWATTWSDIVERLTISEFVDERLLDTFITDYGDHLLDVDAKILEAFGKNTTASLSADGRLQKIGTLASSISYTPDLKNPIIDSFPLRSSLYSVPFWWDIDNRAVKYQSELQARSKPPQPAQLPQQVPVVRRENPSATSRPNTRPTLPTQS